jgi:predicted O-methyltransferase YrrM
VSPQGTAAYDGLTDLPPLVERAVDLARRNGFAYSCRPEHGRLLYALAAGAGRIGETGTGCGVGLAWLAAGARPGTRLFSVELDIGRAALAAELFADQPQVTVFQGDWTKITEEAPFDLLVLDGGGQGKSGGNPEAPEATEAPADPEALLRPGGTLVIDDLTPASTWPPLFAGRPDPARMHWLTHPAVAAAELRLASDLAALVATRRFPG